MGNLNRKSVGGNKGLDKDSFLADFKSSMHIVNSEELKASRNPLYQYMI